MARIRETEVEPVDIGEDSTPARGDGGFGLGVTLGVVIIVTAMLAFAYSQGAFQRADRQTGSASVAETQL
jgi:hypothetical protein